MKLLSVCLALFSPVLMAQDAAWDNSPHARELSEQAARLKPLLDQLTPQDWVAQGAPDTYVSQWMTAKQELEELTNAAQKFEQQPQRLTSAIDTYFRMQSLEWHLESVIDATRKYQNQQLGDQLLSTLRSSSGYRDDLRQYILELSSRKEQEFSIMTRDAQMCREQLTENPPSNRRTPKR
jgi:hypothetical protein